MDDENTGKYRLTFFISKLVYANIEPMYYIMHSFKCLFSSKVKVSLCLRYQASQLIKTSPFPRKIWQFNHLQLLIVPHLNASEPSNNTLMFPLPPSREPSLCSRCLGLAKCYCSSRHDVTSTFPGRKPSGAAQTKEIVVLTREFTHMPQSHLRSVDERSTMSSSCCGEAPLLWRQKLYLPAEG